MTDAVALDEAATAVVEADPVEPAADDAWGDPPRASPGAGAPVLSVEGFEGPLDWLLEMVRAHRIDIARLSIRALIEAFAGAMEVAFRRGQGEPPVSLPRWGDWLVMAAQLTELRSKLLLPAHDPGARAVRGQAETLRRQPLGRAYISAAADWLARRPQLGRNVFARGAPEQAEGASEASRAGTDTGGDITALLRACLVVLELPEPVVAAYRLPPPTLWPIADAMVRVQQRLAALPDGSPITDYLPPIETEGRTPLRYRAAVASTLIAGLMLAQDGQLRLDQDGAWQPIRVGQRNADDMASLRPRLA